MRVSNLLDKYEAALRKSADNIQTIQEFVSKEQSRMKELELSDQRRLQRPLRNTSPEVKKNLSYLFPDIKDYSI